jgi:hypothetical protein
MLEEDSRKMLEEASRKMLTKKNVGKSLLEKCWKKPNKMLTNKCWNIYKMLTKNS